MAIGADTLVHTSCLKYGGKTIAVLPSGFNNIYPKNNKELFYEIINSGGLAITEYSLDFEACTKSFLERNRIIVGLGLGILVIEAGDRSGTNYTSRIAFESNKKVFAIPRKP